MKRFGLVGKKLSYSFSKLIHTYLLEKYEIGGTYELIEVTKITSSLLSAYDGLNITIPYKEDVRPFLEDIHTQITAINTVKNENGMLSGFNTDILGFLYLVEKLGFNAKSVTFAVIGNGATSNMIQTYFKNNVIAVVSKNNDTDYTFDQLGEIKADILVNATPIGMAEFATPIDKQYLSNFKGVIDLNYNPLNSRLRLECMEKEIPFIGGLYMLIIQAIRAFEIWNELHVDEQTIEEIYQLVLKETTSKIAIIGMPLSGKTTFVKKHDGLDVDDEIIKRSGKSIASLIDEGTFRDVETKIISQLVLEGKKLLALGGGAVLKSENIALLKDYTIIFLDTPLADLEKRWEPGARPLLPTIESVKETYDVRYPLYTSRSNIKLTSEQLESWVKK